MCGAGTLTKQVSEEANVQVTLWCAMLVIVKMSVIVCQLDAEFAWELLGPIL